MKNIVSHRIFSTLIALIVLLPFVVQTIHAMEGHEHVYCNAKNETHFHKKEIDCQFYHLKITYNSFNFSNNFSIYQPQHNFLPSKAYQQTYYYSFQSSKSSRAPPFFIG